MLGLEWEKRGTVGLRGKGRAGHTVIVNEIRNTDPKQRRVQTRIQPCNSLSLHNTADSIICRRVSAFRFDLGTGGEGN